MTKTDNTYFVEIIPTGYYFFGNERTFTTTLKDKYGAVVSNYFAESSLYPQQTALLGMLRHSLLIFYNKLEANEKDRADIIGSENFSTIKDTPYGVIDSLSPLVISSKERNAFLLPAGLDNQNYNNRKVLLNYSKAQIKSFNGLHSSTLPVLDNYEYKENLKNYWTDEISLYDERDIFKSITKTGVDKEKSIDAFYKQTLSGLCDGYSFGLWVSFTKDIDTTKLKNEILIPFGADQGLFKLKFHSDKENIFLKEVNVNSFKKIILLSDAWIDEIMLDKIDFGITAYTPFRYINTKKNNFYKLDASAKSKKYALLKRGSVLYPKEGFEASILSKPAMQRIGYNYFKLI